MTAWWRKLAGQGGEETAVRTAADAPPAPASAARPTPTLGAGRPGETPRQSMENALRALTQKRVSLLLSRADGLTMSSDAPQLLETISNSEQFEIAPVPTTVARALRMTRDLDASMLELVDIFESDAALAQEALRMADSAFYRRPGGTITSILDASQRIGMSGLQSVLMGHLASSALRRPGGNHDEIVDAVHRHGVRTASISRRLARVFTIEDETAYSLGLLHDVGKLVLFDVIGGLRAEKRREVRVPPPFLKAMLRELHEPLGGLAALRWGLPPSHARAIARHHRDPQPEQLEPLIELLYVSERADLAQLHEERLDTERWWREGALRSDRGTIEPLIAQAIDELANG